LIFVTVGNATQSFARLLEAVDDLSGKGAFHGEPVFMQTGHNPQFKPRHGQAEAFIPMEACQARMKEARLIISHGGCGTLLQAIGLGKTPVVMPRLSRYREHVNDHQLQLVRALAEEGRIVPAFEAADLPCAIEEAWQRKHQPPPKGPMLELVGEAIKELLI